MSPIGPSALARGAHAAQPRARRAMYSYRGTLPTEISESAKEITRGVRVTI